MEKVSGFFKRLWNWYRKKSKILQIVIGVIATVVVIFIALVVYCSRLSSPSNTNKEFMNYNYSQVVKYLKNQGFKNIKTVSVKDLEQGKEEDKLVKSVSIDGDSNFDSDSLYSSDVPVIVTYHTFSKDSIDLSKVSLTGSKEKVKQNLSEAGFKSVKLVKNDIVSGSSVDLENYSVTIDGSKVLTDYHYSKNAKVKINYNSLSPDAINIKDFETHASNNYQDIVDKLKKIWIFKCN